MFPYVGGINHINREVIDLKYEELKLACFTGVKLSNSDELQKHREEWAAILNAEPNLRFRLDSIRNEFGAGEDITVFLKKDENNTNIVKIFQIVHKKNGSASSVFDRYVPNQGNILIKLSPVEIPNLLPELYVDGPYIKRTDTGEKIMLEGFAIYTPEIRKESLLTNFIRNVETNEKLGIKSNLVRLSFDTIQINSTFLDDLVRVSNYAQSKGIYLYITPHRVHKSELGLPNEEVSTALKLIAERLNPKSNILYGLWNEPGSHPNGNFVTWPELKPWVYRLASEILSYFDSTEQKPIIVIPGTKWSKDFRSLPKEIPFQYAIDVHDYPWVLSNTGPHTIVRNWWTDKIGTIPIIISEMGDPGKYHFCKIEDDWQKEVTRDIDYITETLKIINTPENQFFIHYTIWRGEESCDGFREWDNSTLRERGVLVKHDRENYPTQTDFTK